MANDATEFDRGIEVVVRPDGQGEFRDGDNVVRKSAADADELRADLMEQAMMIAMSKGEPVSVRIVDIDGVYQLVCGPDGSIEQVGEVSPLQPGDDDLTPLDDDADAAPKRERAPKSKPESESVDSATRVPREEMLSPSYDELIADDGALEGAEDAPIRSTDLLTTGPNEVGEGDARDAGDDTARSLLEASPTPAERGMQAAANAVKQQQSARRDAEQADAAGPDEDWAPSYARDRANAKPKSHTKSAATRASDRKPTQSAAGGGPTLDDFFADRAPERPLPAEQGWRAGLRRFTGGAIKLAPGKREQLERDELAAIQRVFDGPRTIVVVNPKGGAHKTTATLMIAAMFGIHRGGYTLAWDNNETRGTLGWRSQPGKTTNTAVDLLRELPHFEVSGGATIADVDRYVRNQGDAKFDVLASDDDAASAAIIDDDAFSRLHSVLARFYRVMVIDTGNNMRASNWEAALDVADQLVIISTAREDTAASAAWLADGLRERGYADKLANAVTILSSPSAKEDPELTAKLLNHFEALTRAVVAVPYDQEFVGGGPLNIQRLAPETRQAWRQAAAVIAQGL